MKDKQISCDYGVCIAKTGWYGVYEVETHTERGRLYVKDRLMIDLDVPLNIVNNSTSDFTEFAEGDESEIDYRICEVFWELSSEESVRVLELLSSVWRNSANKEQDVGDQESCRLTFEQNINWCAAIGILIYNMKRDKEVMERFVDKYKGGLIAENDWSIYSDIERRKVLEWFENSEYASCLRIVCFPFSKLGFSTMYGLWRESKVYVFPEDN